MHSSTRRKAEEEPHEEVEGERSGDESPKSQKSLRSFPGAAIEMLLSSSPRNCSALAELSQAFVGTDESNAPVSMLQMLAQTGTDPVKLHWVRLLGSSPEASVHSSSSPPSPPTPPTPYVPLPPREGDAIALVVGASIVTARVPADVRCTALRAALTAAGSPEGRRLQVLTTPEASAQLVQSCWRGFNDRVCLTALEYQRMLDRIEEEQSTAATRVQSIWRACAARKLCARLLIAKRRAQAERDMPVGSWVVAQGLKKATHLNGCRGRVLRWGRKGTAVVSFTSFGAKEVSFESITPGVL